MGKSQTYCVQLTYAEMEVLLRATHPINAEMLIGPDDADAALFMADAEEIRKKISDTLNEIDERGKQSGQLSTEAKAAARALLFGQTAD